VVKPNFGNKFQGANNEMQLCSYYFISILSELVFGRYYTVINKKREF